MKRYIYRFKGSIELTPSSSYANPQEVMHAILLYEKAFGCPKGDYWLAEGEQTPLGIFGFEDVKIIKSNR